MVSIKAKIKNWLGIPKQEAPKLDLPYLLVNRHYFGSINVTDVDEYLSTMSDAERREYESDAAAVYHNRAFQREIKHLFGQQSLFVANESSNWEQTLIGRGNVNGIGLVEDRFKLLNARNIENIKEGQPIEP